jgi:type II secretory pathway pseudopilin PulG
MNRFRTAGLTLIDLLVVVGIIGLLAACAVSTAHEGRETANIAADKAHLQRIFAWQEIYRQRAGHMPTAGGHKFLLDPWVKEYIDHSPEVLQTYFTPGIDDPHLAELKQKLDRGERVWTSLDQLTPADTHYAGRATEFLRGMNSGLEAWAADDNNEGTAWAFPVSATTNVLYGNGQVRELTLQNLIESFAWPGKDKVLKTFGPDAGHPDLRKLEN